MVSLSRIHRLQSTQINVNTAIIRLHSKGLTTIRTSFLDHLDLALGDCNQRKKMQCKHGATDFFNTIAWATTALSPRSSFPHRRSPRSPLSRTGRLQAMQCNVVHERNASTTTKNTIAWISATIISPRSSRLYRVDRLHARSLIFYCSFTHDAPERHLPKRLA